MSEIESKRNELESKKIHEIFNKYGFSIVETDRLASDIALMLFDAKEEGKEMARKEIIKFLEDNLYYLINKREGKKWVIANIDRKIKEIKQSLEEKT